MRYLVRQCLTFVYDDDLRGQPHAAARARVRGVLLPAVTGAVVEHGWSTHPRRGVSESFEVLDAAPTAHDRMVSVDGDELVIRMYPAASEWRHKPVLRLAVGTWGRLTWNEKQVDYDLKWLTEHVVNAGWFESPPPRDVFLGEPAAAYDARRDFLRNGYLAR